jgi:hypothetical protein
MNGFEFLVVLMYGMALAGLLFLGVQWMMPASTVVVVDERPLVREVGWWPWPVTSYNEWPSWYGGGGWGGGVRPRHGPRYGPRPGPRPPHVGGAGPSSAPPRLPVSHSRPWGGGSRHANGAGFHR